MAVTALITLTDAKTQLNITDGSNDAELQGFIDAATASVEYHTGPIISRTCTEVHDGGNTRIVLDNPPILTMTSVTEYVGATGYVLTQCELGAATGQNSYSVDDYARGIIVRRFTGGFAGAFTGGVRNIQVTYTAGLANAAGVKEATLALIQFWWTHTKASGSVTYGDPTGMPGFGVPNFVLDMLLPYRRGPSIA